MRSMCYTEDVNLGFTSNHITVYDHLTDAMTLYVLSRLARVKSASALTDINPDFLYEDYDRTDVAFCLDSDVIMYPETEMEKAFSSLFTCVNDDAKQDHWGSDGGCTKEQCSLCYYTEGCMEGQEDIKMWKTVKKQGLKPLMVCPDSMSLEEKYGGSYREHRRMEKNSLPSTTRNLMALTVLAGPLLLFLMYYMLSTIIKLLAQKTVYKDIIEQEKTQILQLRSS